MVCLCDPRSMVCNEEEDPKSPLNGWLKAYKVAIDFRGDSVRPGDQIRNPEDPADRGPKRLHAAGGAARAALVQSRKRGCTG